MKRLRWLGRATIVLIMFSATGCMKESDPVASVDPTPEQGVSWTVRDEGVPFYSVTWGAGEFIAVGKESDGPTVWGSPDGVTWEPRASGSLGYLLDATWTGSKFIAVGGYSYCGGSSCCISCSTAHFIWSSTDGHVWTKATLNSLSGSMGAIGGKSRALYAVRPVPGGIVATGERGTILRSTTGETWSLQSTTELSYNLTGIASDGGKTLVIGREGSLSSSNDKSWTAHGTDTHGWISLASSGTGNSKGVWVAVGEQGLIRRSLDGVDWKTRPSGTFQKLNAVTWTGTRFVAVGNFGVILTSLNGLDWTSRASGTQNNLTSVTFAEGRLVAVGPGIVLTSP